jgi:hypothetical protein
MLSNLSALLLAMLPQAAEAAVPETAQPALNPIAWEIELKYEDPKRIEVQTPRGRETYWYVLYTATNTSDQTQRFYPTFQIVTEDLRVYPTDVDVFPLVFQAIRELHKQQYPYLVAPNVASKEPLKVGDDNARQSVAIWREIDLNVNSFSVFVSGLSGEAKVVKNPAYDPSVKENSAVALEIRTGGPPKATFASNPKTFTLRKTLQIDYALPGAAGTRSLVEPQRTRVQWVMR